MARLRDRFAAVTGLAQPLGDPVTYRGLRVTPDVFAVADRVTYELAGSDRTVDQRARDGERYLLTRLTVERTGDNVRLFPLRGSIENRRSDWIQHFYGGDLLENGRREEEAEAFRVREARLPNYLGAFIRSDTALLGHADRLSGWLINVVPAGFTPGRTAVEITWGPSSTLSDTGLKTFTWSLHPDARVDPTAPGTWSLPEQGR